MMNVKEFTELWNSMHVKYIQQGSDIRNETMATWLEEQILAAKVAYYNTGDNIMDDRTYDKMETYLKILKPDSKVLEKVGA